MNYQVVNQVMLFLLYSALISVFFVVVCLKFQSFLLFVANFSHGIV